MKVVYVLGHHGDVEMALELRHKIMTAARLYGEQLTTTLVVEIYDEGWVAQVALDGCNIFDTILLPKAARVPKRAYPTFSRHACTRKNYDFFHNCNI